MKEYLRNVNDYACAERVKFAAKEAIELLEQPLAPKPAV